MILKNGWLCSLALIVSPFLAHAEFLFTGNGDFIIPTLNYGTSLTRYSEWRSQPGVLGFYSTSTHGNLPTYYGEFGGFSGFPSPRPDGPGTEFPYYPEYKVYQPNAFWDASNPTITQTNAATGHITDGGNFYGIEGGQSFRLDDNTSLTSDPVNLPGYTVNTAIFQFQTDGQVVDLSQIRLVYTVGGIEHFLYADDLAYAEYLREYRLPVGANSDPSAAQGYMNRTAIQWNLTGLGISEYRIEWETAVHTSFQQAALDTSDTFVGGIPASRSWIGGDGLWTDGQLWQTAGQNPSTGTVPEANGNLRFENDSAAAINLNVNQVAGEISFLSPENVTIFSANGSSLTANTGISTSESATGEYRIAANFVLGALNFFEIEAGKVVMDGVVSGDYGITKLGDGALVLAKNNTFTGFLDVQGGEVRLEGSNSYAGDTVLRGGRLVIAADGALGSATTPIKMGFDATFFENPTSAEIVLEGARTLNRDIQTVANGSEIIVGARETGGGQAVYSGSVSLTNGVTDVIFRAEGVNDVVAFSGGIGGGVRNRNLIIDGEGTVVFSGAAKTYARSTVVREGTLLLQVAYTGAGNFRVEDGGILNVDGSISASTTTTVSIDNGGRLGGSGSIGRTVVTGGVGSIVEADGGLSLSSLNAAQGVTFAYELPLGGDVLEIAGALIGSDLAEGIRFAFQDVEGLEAGVAYTLLNFGSSQGFEVSDLLILTPGLVLDAGFGTGGWLIEGDNLQVRFSIVPEPSSTGLLMIAAALLVARSRRRVTSAPARALE